MHQYTNYPDQQSYLADLYLRKYSPNDTTVKIQTTLAQILLPCSEQEIVAVTTQIFRAIEGFMDHVGWAPWPMRYSAKEIFEENSGLSNSPPWRNSLESAFFDLCVLQPVAQGLEKDTRFPASPHVAAACLAAEIITECVHALRTLVWAQTSPEDAQRWHLQQHHIRGMGSYPEATGAVYRTFSLVEAIMKDHGLDIFNPIPCVEIRGACEYYYQKFC